MKLVSLPSSFPLVETTVYSDDRRRSQTTRRARQSAIDQQRVKGRGMPYTDDRAAPRRPKQHTSIIESDFHKHLRASSEVAVCTDVNLQGHRSPVCKDDIIACVRARLL